MAKGRTRALLFDLGGVLIEIDFERALRHWAPMSQLPLAELRTLFRFDAAYEQHERGEIEAGDYFAHLRRTLKLEATDAQIVEGWNAIFIREIPQTVAMVTHARRHLPCYCFSNTNRTHQEFWMTRFGQASSGFDRVFVSWELGWRKPEAEAFARVCREIGAEAGEVLFFDDTQENVEGARAAGLQAALVRSPQDVRDALEGLVPRPLP